jgi:O-antigen ligase
MLAFIAGALVMFFPRSKNTAWASVAVLPILLAGSCLFFEHLRPGSISQALHGQDGRIPMWSMQWDLIRQSPWFGVGGNHALTAISRDLYQSNAVYGVPEFAGGIPEPHNAFLGYAVYFGVPTVGFWLLWLVMVVGGCLRGWSQRKADATGVCVLVSIHLVACLGSMLPQDLCVMPMLYAMLGICWHRARQSPPE